jgi:hypothetical protein
MYLGLLSHYLHERLSGKSLKNEDDQMEDTSKDVEKTETVEKNKNVC